LLKEEVESIATKAPKQALKGEAKKAASKSAKHDAFESFSSSAVPEYSASGIDDALDLLTIASKGTAPAASDKLDRHPERRAKSAWKQFEEREMPLLKAENPGLRLSQLNEMLHKKWKKSPENPMVCYSSLSQLHIYLLQWQNQAAIAFNASKDEERAAVENLKKKQLDEFKAN
jgi:Coiled-coil domain-containing protein 124 /Oxs1